MNEKFRLATVSADAPEEGPNTIIEELNDIQTQVAVFSDELDSDSLEDVEGLIELVIDRILDVMDEHGWLEMERGWCPYCQIKPVGNTL